MYDEDYRLTTRLTKLLMENGCTVNKKAIEELAKVIIADQHNLIDKLIAKLGQAKENLTRESGVQL